jgi:addiction module RelE/StbE family toxin
MLVDWRPRARRRLQSIYDYIEEQSPAAADFVFETIIEAAAAIPDHPYVYREGRVPNTREMVVLPNYIVVYRIQRDRIQIVNDLHRASATLRPGGNFRLPISCSERSTGSAHCASRVQY